MLMVIVVVVVVITIIAISYDSIALTIIRTIDNDGNTINNDVDNDTRPAQPLFCFGTI